MNAPILDPQVIHWLQRSVLCWLATVDAQGQPNVSPKEVFAPVGSDHLVLAHIASPCSVRNIAQQPRVCVSFIDVFAQKGFKLQGVADVLRPDDPEFEPWSAPLKPLVGTRFPLHGVIRVRLTDSQPIVAPSYTLYPDTTEQVQVEAAQRTYAARLPQAPTRNRTQPESS
jgi:general stress protein 26